MGSVDGRSKGTTMVRRTERRRFLGQAIGMTVAAGTGAGAGGRAVGQVAAAPRTESEAAEPSQEAKGSLPIIDTHQHLWDLDRFRLPWLKDAKPLAHSFLMDDYLKAAEGLG